MVSSSRPVGKLKFRGGKGKEVVQGELNTTTEQVEADTTSEASSETIVETTSGGTEAVTTEATTNDVLPETTPESFETIETAAETSAIEEPVQMGEYDPSLPMNSFQMTTSAAAPKVAELVDVVQINDIGTGRVDVNVASCVKAMKESANLLRNSLHLEVAVALAIFAASSTGSDRPTRRKVMEVYAAAGFEVTPTGKDYKTASRRILASSDLFDLLGKQAIVDATTGLRDGKAITRLQHYLDNTYKFDSINALLEFVGKPVQQTNTPEVRAARSAKLAAEIMAGAVDVTSAMAARRSSRQPMVENDDILLFSGPLTISVPRSVTPTEIRAMAAKLTEFAERMEAEIGSPEDQRNRAMHS